MTSTFLTVAYSLLTSLLLRRLVRVDGERVPGVGLALRFPETTAAERAKIEEAFAAAGSRVVFTDRPLGDA